MTPAPDPNEPLVPLRLVIALLDEQRAYFASQKQLWRRHGPPRDARAWAAFAEAYRYQGLETYMRVLVHKLRELMPAAAAPGPEVPP
jgi:hypothetical protein